AHRGNRTVTTSRCQRCDWRLLMPRAREGSEKRVYPAVSSFPRSLVLGSSPFPAAARRSSLPPGDETVEVSGGVQALSDFAARNDDRHTLQGAALFQCEDGRLRERRVVGREWQRQQRRRERQHDANARLPALLRALLALRLGRFS